MQQQNLIFVSVYSVWSSSCRVAGSMHKMISSSSLVSMGLVVGGTTAPGDGSH